jgi:cellulose synthase/poly-beta-1,6-N-acetylglucosamine synthase-like glycosyltransferase
MSGIERAFFIASALLVYLYLGYPALIRLWAKLRPREVRRRAIEPHVSVLLAVHDEADRIERRLENLVDLDYPKARIQILVGSDGSSDPTVALAETFGPRGVEVRAFAGRRGKASTLNDLALAARGEILVFADARQRFEPRAIRALVAPFADEAVGAVGGELRLDEDGADDAVGHGVSFYWRYETSIRRSESLVDSTVGASGALYAVRRHLFEPLPASTVLDDALIPLRVVRRGYRVVFEPEARAHDRPPRTAHEELTRKVRTIAGNVQLFTHEPWLLSPLHNRVWFQTVSHKLLRLASPVLLVAALASSAALAARPAFAAVAAAQLAFYLAAAIGALQRGGRRAPTIVSVPYAMCLLNWATAVALVRSLSRRPSSIWDRPRPF